MGEVEEIRIESLKEAKDKIKSIGCDEKSIDIMAPKAVFKVLLIRNVEPVDAIIVKQDMLSIGGEVAIPKDVFWRKEACDIMAMGTLRHFMTLAEKLKRHHSRIKRIADLIGNKVEEWLQS